MMNSQEIKDQICDVCHKMWQLGWVAANDGNVSVKMEDGTYWITPSGISKSFMTPEKLIHVNEAMEKLEGAEGLVPSSEIKMHMRCYREREDAGAVVHAHPPTATGYAAANQPLDQYSMIETVIAIGSVPVTPLWRSIHLRGARGHRSLPGAARRAAAKPRCADGGLRPDHRLLPDGNPGIIRQDQPDCPSAGRGTGDPPAQDRPVAGAAGKLLPCDRKASGLPKIQQGGRRR